MATPRTDEWTPEALREHARTFARTYFMDETLRMHPDVRDLLHDLQAFLTSNPKLREHDAEEFDRLTVRVRQELKRDPEVKHR